MMIKDTYNNFLKFISAAAVIVVITSCIRPPDLSSGRSFSDNPSELFVLNGLSETISVINTEDFSLHNDIINTGKWPNDITIIDDYIYVINSGDNTLQIISENSLTNIDSIYIGENNNPWNCAFNNNIIYIPNFVSGNIFAYSVLSNKIILSNKLNSSIEDAAVCQGMLYVCHTGFSADTMNFSGSSVYVLDLLSLSVIKNIQMPKNPQSIIDIPSKNEVHIVCSGDNASNDGEIAVIDADSITVKSVFSVGGSPAYSTVDYKHGIAYLSGSGGVLSYSISNLEVINSGTNMLLSDNSELYTGIVFDDSLDYIYTAAFSSDKIIVYSVLSNSIITNITVSDGPQKLFLYRDGI